MGFLASALILLLIVFAFHPAQMRDGPMVATTIAVAALCLILIFNTGITVVDGCLALLLNAVEWIGRQPSGEAKGSTGSAPGGP